MARQHIVASISALFLASAVGSGPAQAQVFDGLSSEGYSSKTENASGYKETRAPAATAATNTAPTPVRIEAAPKRRNGIGSDKDGDTNPATNVFLTPLIGADEDARFDPPYRVVTFESKLKDHGKEVETRFRDALGVSFSSGLRLQVCEGQRYYQYNSECTYLRAPSGKFAAAFRDDFRRPLTISFDGGACTVALAIQPTGGKENELFEASLQGYSASGAKLTKMTAPMRWTKNTFRWRHMLQAYFTDEPAARVEVSVISKDRRSRPVRFLIDDVAYLDSGCGEPAVVAGASEGS
ncbi:MAG: hypothetical protein AAF850_02280 [Pseudomonadota bacterium]